MIVFVGPGMTSFEQLAASAGRRGVETAWVGYPESWARRMRQRAFVSHVASAHGVASLALQLRRLGVDRIADIQCSEYVLADVVAAAREAGVSPPLKAELLRRHRLTDKLTMSRLLDERGVRVPPTRDAQTTTAAEAEALLGKPLVIKGRVGNGGSAVTITDSLSEAAAAAAAAARFGGALFEQFVEGETISYSAAYGTGGMIAREAVYLTQRVDPAGLGPPDRVRLIESAAVMATGRSVLDAIGGAGLVNVNLITDSAGRSWVHDVNLRPWGTLLALRQAGIDFVAAYLEILGAAEPSPDVEDPRIGAEFDVFPAAAVAAAEGNALEGLRVFAGQVDDYRRWAGPGYVAAELARATAIVMRGRVRRLGRVRSPRW